MKTTVMLLSCALAMLTSAAQTPQTPARGRAAAPAPAPKFKAIWEPVPFNKDLNLSAISCVGPETCWAVGDKSTILATTDGGSHWQVQLGGDPASTDPNLARVSFLDARHGWAMTAGGTVLGTSDGSTWAELSTVSGTSLGVWFLNPTTGLEIENPSSTSQSTVQRSEDGGRTWRPVSRCRVDATVGGLPRQLDCRMRALQVFSPTAVFAGGGASISMEADVATFGKSTDGGRTWTMSVIPDSKWHVTDISFWTENDGVAVLSGGEEVRWTNDGGATWTRAVKQRLWPSRYGVGGGQIIVGVGEGSGIGYSFDGGRTFTSRPFVLPARPQWVTFPDATHGYLVGQHAMVFRYRIVPIEYTRPGMLAAMAR